MEITLDKIELVKDRTGVTYKEAKDALEAANGSVVDAIIAIEETVDIKQSKPGTEWITGVIDKVKEVINRGNISRITVTRNDNVLINIPVTASIIGVLLAPWGMLAAVLAAFGTKCEIKLSADDGTVYDISEMTKNYASKAVEKGSVIVEEVKERTPDAWEKVKAKGTEVYDAVKEKAPDTWEAIKTKGTEVYDAVKEKAPEGITNAFEQGKEKFEDLKNKGQEKIAEFKDKGTETLEDLKNRGNELYEEVKEMGAGVIDNVQESVSIIKDDIEVEVEEKEVSDELDPETKKFQVINRDEE